MISAYHLPGLPGVPAEPRASGGDQGAGESAAPGRLLLPRLTPQLLRTQMAALREARERHLAERPVAAVVEAIDAVAVRLLDSADPLRQTAEQELPALTGFSPPMVRAVLDRMADDWRGDRLWPLLRAELGDPRVLDGFRPRRDGAGRTRALGPALVTHVFSGNVPGVAVTSLVRALLVKSASLGKAAWGEPLLPALFARGLAEVDAGLGECVAVGYWQGGDEAMEEVALGGADAVVAYGGREAIRALRSRTPPETPFVGYGHRLSFGVVAREALDAERGVETVRSAARAAALFDQQGCVSPHLFYVETGGRCSPAEWAERLAGALADVEAELPRGRLSAEEAAQIQQLRGQAEFAGLDGAQVLYASPGGTQWTVVYDPEPGFEPSCLNRVVRVKPVSDLLEVARHAAPVAAVLQSVGVAGPDARLRPLAESLARLGASRIAPLGELAWPPPAWHHDGRPPLGVLLRWCDWE